MIRPSMRHMITALPVLLALTACSDSAKEKLGLARRSPDEFAVISRAPLEMPPEYTLPPPTPGAARPQEESPQRAAEAALWGNVPAGATSQRAAASKAEDLLLEKTGAHAADPNIRSEVDAETRAKGDATKPTIDRILDIGGNSPAPAKIVNPAAEAQRIQQNKKDGKPVTDGETPSVIK